MRLIDADALIEHLREYKTVYGVPMTDSDKQVVHCIIGHIKNLEPTAYDVEAVVEKLAEKSWLHAKHLEFYASKICDDAISIVRGKE